MSRQAQQAQLGTNCLATLYLQTNIMNKTLPADSVEYMLN